MSTLPQALISPIRNMTDDGLLTFCNSVKEKTYEVPAYSAVAELSTRMVDELTLYQAALTKAQKGTSADKYDKNEKKKNLQISAGNLGKGLTIAADGNGVYILEAGYDLHRGRSDSRGPLAAPIVDNVRATGVPGEAKARIDRAALSTGWEQIIAEYSTDNGLTWTRCYQSRRTVVTINGLPNTRIQLRFYVTGSGNRVSPYSPITELGIA